MDKKRAKTTLRKIWHFIWEDNSVWSWIVNIILAFVLIKFIVYPGLGFLLGTSYPIVAVVSESMEHNNAKFDDWWQSNKDWYENIGIDRQKFESFLLKNGFNKGDIMVLLGQDVKDIKIGDVIVYRTVMKDPIIHRVVNITNYNGKVYFQTKGDNNKDFIKSPILDERRISSENLIGKAVFRIPFFGYIKIIFVDYITKPYCSATNNLFPCRS